MIYNFNTYKNQAVCFPFNKETEYNEFSKLGEQLRILESQKNRPDLFSKTNLEDIQTDMKEIEAKMDILFTHNMKA